MIATFALTTLLAFTPAPGVVCIDGDAVAAVNADDHRALWEAGTTYEDFLASADRRRSLWRANTEKAEGIDPALVARARAVGGRWHFLVVAVAACSDSVSTVPYLARLAALVDGVELRIVDSDAGRAIMEANPTPDGRAATPTILLLDGDFEERGCFIERPRSLQDWIIESGGRLSAEEIFEGKMEWYAEDAGAETVSEMVSILEAAASGGRVCGR